MRRMFVASFTCALIAMATSAFMNSAARGATADVPDGRAVYVAKCAACHQANGAGGGPFPPLAGNSDVTNADTGPLIQSVLNGRNGPIVVKGATYGGTMPAWKDQLKDEDIAAVLTYLRSAWGNAAAAVTAQQIGDARHPVASSGAQLFAAKCASCHQAAGTGSTAYPPLDANPHVLLADPREIIATIANGRAGALTVNGTSYSGKMPAWKGQLSNADIAAVATFVRTAWTNKAAPVTEQQVAAAGTPVLNTVGTAVYAAKCAACHGASGQGGGHGQFPALKGDGLANAADAKAMIGLVQRGRSMMPAWRGQLSPADTAAVITFIRAAWGNTGGAVSEADIAAVK